MKKIVIMPGGFHPFHAGHLSLYNAAKQAFPDAEVFVAATDDTSTRPFPFQVKEKLAQLAGVDPGHFVKVKSPFSAKEITQHFDPDTTELIFVRSEKDRNKPPQAGGIKKSGEPAYLQPLTRDVQPMSKHAYMTYLPTVEFGPGITSATEIRTAWPGLNDKRKQAMVMSLYPKTQGNPALVQNVIKMLDTAIGNGPEQINEGMGSWLISKLANLAVKSGAVSQEQFQGWLAENVEEVRMEMMEYLRDHPYRSVIAPKINIMMDRLKEVETPEQFSQGVRIVSEFLNHAVRLEESDPDYIEEKWSQKYKRSIDCSHPKGFSQRAHCAGRKKKVNESSGYSLQGSFTPDLTLSKVWLLDELAKIEPTVGTVYILGSWYGNLALYMNLQPTVKYTNIINVETDQSMLDQSQRMLDHIGADNIEYMNKDANDLDYRQLGNAGVVINCSLTDMDGTDWFRHIPDGTLVVMQARDHDPGYQFNSPEDIVKKFPLSQVLYSGTKHLQDPETHYNRFMVIGRK